MRFVAIEYDNKVNNTHTKGYLRISEGFSGEWYTGLKLYLQDTYKAENINIYPLNVHLTSDNMGNDIAGYTNMEDDFNMALRSNNYYPQNSDNDHTRRSFSLLDPASPDFYKKGR